MINLNSYIIEKLHLDKNIKVDEREKSEDYVFAIPYNEVYDKFIEMYSDALVQAQSGSGGANGFLIPLSDMKDLKDTKDCTFYSFSNLYEYMEDFVEAWENGECFEEDLKRIY